ncbi:MAG: hypothetical protein K2N65_03720 [Anaeroplasmataceae bacterium]|nr:hypothetical protein [Anaeroplasmataceae bacterium]
MHKPILYVIGDSTVSNFNDPYYYPRYGYGTQLDCYLKNIEVINLALSGRSSKSFIEEENYKRLMNQLKAGDYLMIGFGHNDEKSDDPLRFTDASKPVEDPASFSYSLYEHYIKPALEKKATPILCTPICRADIKNEYTGSSAHITPNGNYADTILKLGKEKGILVLDLTSQTKQQYQKLGYQEASLYHATIAGKFAKDGKTTLPDEKTVDTTHLNHYGAKFVAYLVATLLRDTDSSLKEYLIPNLVEPKKETDLFVNPEYVIKTYTVPQLENYSPNPHFQVLEKGWYGTAFGDCGGNPNEPEHGFVARSVGTSFEVGQSAGGTKGKISLISDGLAFCFRQVSVEDNFELSAYAKILKAVPTKQAGFGLMLRDDCYINQASSTEIVTSNYLAAGLVTTDLTMSPIFYREQAELHKEEPLIDHLYQVGDTAEMKIVRVGQSMTMQLVYEGKTYEKVYVDFDLLAMDHTFMYIGMFATRGTVVEFSNVKFKLTGKSQGA